MSHPLADIFEHLDQEDYEHKRLVVSQETGEPGQGFFDTYSRLHKITIRKADRTKAWLDEFRALTGH
jgi:hypothetical protein